MDPISTLRDLGLSTGAVAIVVSLFIWNTVELRALRAKFDEGQNSTDRGTTLVAKIVEDQAKISEQLAVLAANLVNLTSTVNTVVRELITVVRDVEK